MIPKLGALRFLGDRPALPQLSHGRQLHSQCTAGLPRQLVTSWCQGSGPQRGRKGGLPRERQEGGKRGGEATAQGAGRCLLNGPQDQAPPHGRRPLPSTCSSRREGTLSSASSPPPPHPCPQRRKRGRRGQASSRCCHGRRLRGAASGEQWLLGSRVHCAHRRFSREPCGFQPPPEPGTCLLGLRLVSNVF